LGEQNGNGDAKNELPNKAGGLSPDMTLTSVLNQHIAKNTVPDSEVFIQVLRTSPSEGLNWLVRLPPTLIALDFVTKVLTSGVFEGFEIGAGDITRQHLQHMLRQIEAMQPGDDAAEGDGEQHSTEEQARAITLVIVYLRNLLGRGFVKFETIHLDVQEICVRYIWLPEVREFRTWIKMTILGLNSSLSLDGLQDHS
jgi:hypothetical protein